MSNHYATADRVSDGVAFTIDTAATVELAFGKPVHVRRALVVVTVATTVAASTVTVALRDRDNSPTVDIGSFVIPAGVAIGSVVYAEIGANQTQETLADGTIRYESGTGDIKVMPWQELAFTTDGGATAGTGVLYVEYSEGGQEIYEDEYVKAVYTPA